MVIVVLKIGWFSDSEESHFQAAKRSDMSSAILQEVWFGDAQVKRFQAVFIQIFVMPSCKGVD